MTIDGCFSDNERKTRISPSAEVGITAIWLYRKASFPFYFVLHKMHFDVCNFEPSCSHYTEDAIRKYGLFKGSFMGAKRIARCNPFNKGGYDPVN